MTFKVDGPKYFLTHLGLFGQETVLMQKHDRPDANGVIPGALLWNHEEKKQYFLFASELATAEVQPSSPSGGHSAEGPALLRSGILFQSADYLLPDDTLGLFGLETMLIKKHVWPARNAALPGALLWDAENRRQYFVPSNELVSLDQILGHIEESLAVDEPSQ
jgi:hypothetical protein